MYRRFPLLWRIFSLGLTVTVLAAWLLTFCAFWFTGSVLPRETITLPEEWPYANELSSNSRLALLHHLEPSVPGGRLPTRLWDWETQRLCPELVGQTGFTHSVAVSPDGATFATVAEEQIVRLWDLATAQELRTFRMIGDRPIVVAYSPDGKSLVAASVFHARRWDVSDGRELATLKFGPGLQALRFTEAGEALVVVYNSRTNTVEFWELDSGRQRQTIDLSKQAPVYQLAVSPDGRTLASTHLGGAAKLWDVAAGQVLEEYTTPEGYGGMAFSPDGRWLAISYGHPSVVGSRILSWIPQAGPLVGRAFEGESGTVVIDRATGTTWSGLPSCWLIPAFSADGATLIIFGSNKGMQYFGLPPHRQLFTPFAWVFLSMAMVLSVVWWRLRGGLRGTAGLPAPSATTPSASPP